MLEFLETKLFWITATLAAAIYWYLHHYIFNYWQRHEVPCEPPSIPFGNIPLSHFFRKCSLGDIITKNYAKFSKHPFHGFYVLHKPIIVINDPELIKTILIKEFDKFHDRGWFTNDKLDSLSGHLFLMRGDNWRGLRAKLSPIFTSGKLKQMYPLFDEISNEMINTCNAELGQSDVLEMKDIIARYTTDIISSVVYGLEGISLKHPKNEFRFNGVTSIQHKQLTKLTAIFLPEILEKLQLHFFKSSVTHFFVKTFNDMVNYRRKEKIVRKDFLNLLMQLMDHGEVEDDEGKIIDGSHDNLEKMTMIQGAAQAFVFFIAGYETASSTATYTLLELAMNPEIQEKLRNEVDEMVETTGINYSSVMKNEYLDMVLSETLRKHPSVPFLNRRCIEDFRIPNSNFTIPNGMRILISAAGIHRNPEFYPDPEKFDPLRFTSENVAKRSNYVNLGFGDGPRFCIGKRFGQLQAKQAIVKMLLNYKFYVSEKTEIPVKYATDMFVQSPQSGVYLRLEKRSL